MRIRCERIGVAMTLDPMNVLRHEQVIDPFGQRALLVLVDVVGTPVQVVVSSSDLVFQPDDSVEFGGLRGRAIKVDDMPPMVGYSELLRDLTAYEVQIAVETDQDRVLGMLAMLRYFLAGAARLDMDCAELTKRWERLWERFSTG